MVKHKKYHDLQFEKKNKNLQKLPSGASIQKRAIPRPPIACPYAGAHVPKFIYVSTHTPFMSAVKRVQKFLREVEKRALSRNIPREATQKRINPESLKQLVAATETLGKEPIYIKATGRAIDKAMSLKKWFEQRGEYVVAVKTGTVLVVDDIVKHEQMEEKQEPHISDPEKTTAEKASALADRPAGEVGGGTTSAQPESRKRKRRLENETADLPESRTRWVNMVEVSVAYK